MERSHHLTAALYFGIAALEAFINARMREHLRGKKTEEEIFGVLRGGQIVKKLKKWPEEILGKTPQVAPETLELLADINDVRGNLTHPKTSGHDIYSKLEAIDPLAVVEAVAEYIVRYHEVSDTRYPYWIFGWNYLNPRRDTYEIFILNDQQFCSSLRGIGFSIPYGHSQEEEWRNRYLKTYKGYRAIRDALRPLDQCEPKFDRFPFKPILCREWWKAEHHKTCGHITKEALLFARNYDA